MNNVIPTELPQYQCHKIVRGAKITRILANDAGGTNLIFDEIEASVSVPTSWMDKHRPVINGYCVVYDGNYISFSPALAFESGYSRI